MKGAGIAQPEKITKKDLVDAKKKTAAPKSRYPDGINQHNIICEDTLWNAIEDMCTKYEFKPSCSQYIVSAVKEKLASDKIAFGLNAA